MKTEIIKKASPERVFLLDEIRGFAIICMVFYHAGYDLVFLFDVNMPFFTSSIMNTVRDVFAGIFIFISGAVCHYSRSNFRRGVICFSLGMLLTLITWLFIPDQIILFGILHLLGICMIIFAAIGKLTSKIPKPVGYAVFLLLFFFTYNLPWKNVGIPGIIDISLPNFFYDTNLFPLGFPSDSFFSSDYFPIMPWLFLFFTGTYFGQSLKEHKMPNLFYRSHFAPLSAVGRNTIIIYLLHQPVIYGIMELIKLIVK